MHKDVIQQHWAVDFGLQKPCNITAKISYRSRFLSDSKKPTPRGTNIITESEHKKINSYIRDLNNSGINDPKVLLKMVLDVDYMKPYLSHKQGRSIIANKIFKIQQWDGRKSLSVKKYQIIDLLKSNTPIDKIIKITGANRGYVNEITRHYKRFGERYGKE